MPPFFSDSRFYIYGPPGAGKSTLGKALADALELPFTDLDQAITTQAGMDIPAIFSSLGENAFRKLESDALVAASKAERGVIALGGGALLSTENRVFVESAGQVVCLQAAPDELERRLASEAAGRPLLGAGADWREKLRGLLARRAEHYASFKLQLETSSLDLKNAAWQLQVLLGGFRVGGMKADYDVRVISGGLDRLGSALAVRGMQGPVALVCDANVAPLYAPRAADSLREAGFILRVCTIPSGEEHKRLETIATLWGEFLQAGLERSSTVVALGGGVTGDMAGFAAATYLRGVRWVGVPTTLLSMVDASLGGKTGFDLPQGKNLVGAFYPPSLVLADPQLLATLPEGELRSGMAEVIKHGILADPGLYERCAGGWEALRGPDPTHPDWDETVRRAMAVKIRVIQIDPYEKGIRATLNLGHTLGHAIEAASGYTLRHGEAVAIGTVAVARLAVEEGYCAAELPQQFAAVFQQLGLPVEIPSALNRQAFLTALKADKKRAGGKVRFAVPFEIGHVEAGIVIERDFTTLLPEAL
jgi:shikimate kinase / 3-dehydroquinate synthase